MTTPAVNEKKQNFLISRIKKYQVITFTLSFLFFYNFIFTIIFYFIGRETFLEKYKLNIWFFIVAIPIAYFIQWLIATWVASKFTIQTLKEKFYRHPIATIILTILYLIDLPYRLSGSRLVSAFELIVYYAFISFLWWLFICWISERIWKKQIFQWNWYKITIDKVFVFIPLLYKFILGLIIAFLVFIILFLIITKVFHYSGSDLKKLFN